MVDHDRAALVRDYFISSRHRGVQLTFRLDHCVRCGGDAGLHRELTLQDIGRHLRQFCPLRWLLCHESKYLREVKRPGSV